MHELVLEFVREAPVPVCLSRMPLDDGALVACFAVGKRPRRRRAGEPPMWLAKLAYGARGCRRLGAEAQALGQLEPLAGRLRLPRLLGWREQGAGNGVPSACLIQSGVPGLPLRSRWPHALVAQRLPRGLQAAGEWLQQFQQWIEDGPVAGPRQDLLALAAAACDQAEARARRQPECARLLTAMLPVIERAAAAVGHAPPAQAIHGDFWAGNILVAPPGRGRERLGVIDWSGLGAGSALDDILTWVAQVGCGSQRSRLARWRTLFFAHRALRRYLQAWAAAAGYAPAAARLAFYLFLQRRLRWELGWDLQTRNPTEQGHAIREWSEVLAWLAQRHFPDPCAPQAA